MEKLGQYIWQSIKKNQDNSDCNGVRQDDEKGQKLVVEITTWT